MSFEPIKRILTRSVQSAPMSKELQIARVFEAWQTVLSHLWGEEKAAYIVPVSFKEGVLKVSSTSPAAKQQLNVEMVRLKNEVNRYLSERVVMSIAVVSKGF